MRWITLGLLVAAGCTFGTGDDVILAAGATAPDYWGDEGADIDVVDVLLTGELGRVTNIDTGRVASAWSSDDDAYAYIEVHGSGIGGVAMQGISFNRGIADLQVGDSFVVRNANCEECTDDACFDGCFSDREVDIIGCSGPSAGNWEYDVPPDEIEVDVGEGPTEDTMEVTVTATFEDGQTVISNITLPTQS